MNIYILVGLVAAAAVGAYFLFTPSAAPTPVAQPPLPVLEAEACDTAYELYPFNLQHDIFNTDTCQNYYKDNNMPVDFTD